MISPQVNQQQRRVTASLYLILGSGMGLLASQVYLSGYYQAILLPTLLAPILLGLGLLRWHASTHQHHDPAAITALLSLGIFLLFQPETLSGFTHWHFAGLFYPLIAFYLLPSTASLALSLLLLFGLLAVRLNDFSLEEQLVFCMQYLLLLCCAWLYGLSSRLTTQQLERLVGQDAASGLLNADHLESRLYAETARARATHRPLAFLLVELHQYPDLIMELGPAKAQNFIKEASQLTLKTCRTGDEAFRLNQLTLVLLLPNTTINGALVLRERVYQHLLHQLTCELGPLDVSITPLLLQPGEKAEGLWQRIADSCYHSLSDRVGDQLETSTRNTKGH